MAKPTFNDIALRAGVGVATVERVLNGRGGVRPATVERVIAAARALDYPRRLPEVHRGLLRIEILLVRPETGFYARLSRAFERIAATLDPTVRVHRTFLDEADPEGIARRVAQREPRRAGLILAVPDHAAIRAAVAGLGPDTPIVHVVTRAHESVGELVAIDNRAAGRSAAMFIARMRQRPGTVIAVSHHIYEVHRARLRGFSDYFAEHGPEGLAFRWIGFTRDDRRVAGDLLFRAFDLWPDLVGIYNAGGGNTGLIDALRRHPRGRELFFVGHELSEATEAALRDGIMDIVLDQAPEAQARRAIDLMLRRIGLLGMEPDTRPIRFTTVTAESL
ncbi:LacI family DNA-binding transcriptional regulator [Amaricoccus solimangrovi]|uniref:Substrate-binding domain-containing protein n=1 Tax=Amaricoccus solimangrovi TaxID=2589815 RepID=A0A501WWR2_9RHOB|nr:LacI family DNA-binding transcriptional regulator [Amaricoccus solimangrovi]TPE53709.1 substrate-binding domain-containing protein [Amaricoccus solimangrovi]